jgi:hypothetical protein
VERRWNSNFFEKRKRGPELAELEIEPGLATDAKQNNEMP